VTFLYNFLMLAVDVVAIRYVGRRSGWMVWWGAMISVGVVATGMAGVLGGSFEDHFGFFRLLAYGVFGHGTVLLAATAVLYARRKRPLPAGIAIAATAALLLVAADAFLVEPHWLEITRLRITNPKIHHPMRIVVVADLQTRRLDFYERDVLQKALAEQPDVVLLAGDYLQTPRKEYAERQIELRDFLREIHFAAPRGVFAVQGNVEWHDWKKMFEGLDITAVSSNASFELGEVQLTCLGLGNSYSTRQEIENPNPDRFHIVLGHVPNFALGKVEAELLVAGHTHGGQVRLPWIGPIITHASIPHRWAAGLTDLPGSGQLLVSRGIGLERGYAPAMRFLCRPELIVIELAPGEAKGTTDERR
jgi:uncharacterized protein